MMKFCRINKLLLLPMTFILPFWLVFGRGIFGSGGWLSFVYLFTVAPAVFVTLLIFGFLVKPRDSIDTKPRLGVTESVLLTTLYTTLFLHGFFIVDGGDTAESISSVATKIFGKVFEHASYQLSVAFFDLSLILALLVFAILVYERVRKPLP